ncbi:MAG: cobalt-precorrin-6B (C15)-methyltransferase [Thermoanaerobacteraceae bacterium]|nr:precorrin-6Y C5,15-methyltransferase (decarboxylating) subunit CbiT [Biomaibacter acetigenes]MDN5301520.1 cobalt-precorrin-6B (C15)-methyltransferase [Thermoanaerobacteraceae bacterium]
MWEYAFGIPDGLFVRGDVPMTKEEVRAISLSKLRLKKDFTVWDIGAGTGAVSVEAALYCKEGRVYAVEKDEKALKLIRQNTGAFGTLNLTAVPGEAPEVLFDLPDPDRVFIGGSGGKIAEILTVVMQRLKAGGVIVINAVTMETVHRAQEFLYAGGYEVETILVNVARSVRVGGSTLMQARNPVFILSVKA